MKLKTAAKPPEYVLVGTVDSPVGKLLVGVTDKGEICRLTFLRGHKIADALAGWQAQWKQTNFVKGAVVGDWVKKPILLVGTAFQQSVWRAMTEVPKGKVTTYGDIANHIGKPKAFRAVGTACGANPVPYLIPCHRVLGANGGLGGFSSGLEMKVDLLKLDGFLQEDCDVRL